MADSEKHHSSDDEKLSSSPANGGKQRLEARKTTSTKATTEEQKQQDVPHVYIADKLSTTHQIAFVATTCMAMFTMQLGMGNTLGIVSVIGQTYGITQVGILAWMVAGYSLTVGTFILIAGRIGDEYGHKITYIAGCVWFALWSLIAGVSVYSSHVLFIFCRCFAGMGAAIMLPNALALLGSSFAPGPRQNMAFAWFGGSAPWGAIAGFFFGGVFALAWWPWTYWSLAIGLAFLAVVATWTIPDPAEPPTPPTSLREMVQRLDLLGGSFGVAALVLINFAWNQATYVGWSYAYVYVCLILGFLAGGIFAWIETRIAAYPILPFSAFNADIGFVFGCTAAGWGCFGIWVFYAAQIAQQLQGVSPLLLAAWYSPVIPSGLATALLVGHFLGKVQPAYIMVIGQVAYFVGSILIATMPIDAIYWTHFFFSTLIICIGMDSSFPAATIIFSNAVPPKFQGIAASVVATIVNYSISLSLGFAGTAERYTNNGGTTDANELTGYRNGMWVSVGLAGLGILLSAAYVIKIHVR